MSLNLFKPGFGSDNHSGVHPRILESLEHVNQLHAPSYGTDPISQKAEAKFKELFGQNCHPFLVFNGTAANVLSLCTLAKSWQSVLCTDISHLNVDECGAPEALARCKLIAVPHQNGKLCPSRLKSYVTRLGDQHFSQVKVISVTQPTELGTVYTLDELRALRAFADDHQLLLHVDGARLTNAIHFLKISFTEFMKVLRPDAISFGGTKNGLLGGEAVLLFSENLAQNFKYVRKQMMQLPSKMRFIAAQFLAYFESDLHLKIAAHSCHMAQYLAEQLRPIGQAPVLFPVESNAVFIKIPKDWTKPLRDEMFFYVWDPEVWSIRLMTSFDTQTSDIDQFVKRVKQLQET